VPAPRKISCLINNKEAQLFCETAGKGTPFVMIHAGVADSRQWNKEFAHFSQGYKAVRYDLRGYGRSEPVDGDFNHMDDLMAVLEGLDIRVPAILMGCSLGGSLALDFALEHPERVKALIMVGSGPSGLDLDVPESPKFPQARKAWESGDIDLAAELETQIWFDGQGRAPDQVDPEARRLAYEMDRLALRLDARKLGKRVPNTDKPAAERLSELQGPVLVIVGAQDEPYSHGAADYMIQHAPSAQKALIEDAAHLPNMDHPDEFRQIVEDFLRGLPA